jgi:hypothetical protein
LAGVSALIDKHLAPEVVFPPAAVAKALDIATHARPVTSNAAEFASAALQVPQRRPHTSKRSPTHSKRVLLTEKSPPKSKCALLTSKEAY